MGRTATHFFSAPSRSLRTEQQHPATMDEVDKKFSELFIIPTTMNRTMSIRSQRSEMKEEGLQRRSSIKTRILGVFQSSKHSRESSPEPTRSLRRKSHQQVERISTWPGVKGSDGKEKAVDRGHTKSTSTTSVRPSSPKMHPPVSMDRYPRLRSLTSQDHSAQLPTLAKTNPLSSKSTTPTSNSRNLPTATRQLSTRAKHASTVSRTFSFTRRLSMQAEVADTPTPQTQPITIHPPASLASQIFSTLLDNTHKHSKSNSTSTTGRDSKFSSVCSLPSTKSLESTPRTSAAPSPTNMMSKPISDAEFAQLESIVRRVERRLNQQYEQCQQLAANLVRLSGRKLYSLQKTDALIKSVNMASKPEIAAMRGLINSAKEKVRVMFLKKSSVVQTGSVALAAAKEALTNAKREHLEGPYIIDMEPFAKLRSTLMDDICRQRNLDENMKDLLVSLCQNSNFQYNPKDRHEMRQFGPFFNGRLQKFDITYDKVEALCVRIETIESPRKVEELCKRIGTIGI